MVYLFLKNKRGFYSNASERQEPEVEDNTKQHSLQIGSSLGAVYMKWVGCQPDLYINQGYLPCEVG